MGWGWGIFQGECQINFILNNMYKMCQFYQVYDKLLILKCYERFLYTYKYPFNEILLKCTNNKYIEEIPKINFDITFLNNTSWNH